jgi:hypothetical protein
MLQAPHRARTARIPKSEPIAMPHLDAPADLSEQPLELARELPGDPDAVAATQTKAAAAVTDFTYATALAGLDACLGAADDGAHTAARVAADRMRDASRLLIDEVNRFRSLQRRG